jgi:hypothetical protein
MPSKNPTAKIAQKLVDLCRKGENLKAIATLLSPSCVSIEPCAGSGPVKQRTKGKAAIKKKNQWWYDNHTIHSAEVNGPWPHGDRFIVHFKYEVTVKNGPMAGQRFTMEEGALYTVKNAKIVKEEFFYDMEG